MRENLLQSMTGIPKRNRKLLQSVTGTPKCDGKLLESVTCITKYDIYYKVRHSTFLKTFVF